MNIHPLWYIEEKTLVAILQVIKNLNEDIRKEIIIKITLQKSEEQYHKEINYENNIKIGMNSMRISDCYL